MENRSHVYSWSFIHFWVFPSIEQSRFIPIWSPFRLYFHVQGSLVQNFIRLHHSILVLVIRLRDVKTEHSVRDSNGPTPPVARNKFVLLRYILLYLTTSDIVYLTRTFWKDWFRTLCATSVIFWGGMLCAHGSILNRRYLTIQSSVFQNSGVILKLGLSSFERRRKN